MIEVQQDLPVCMVSVCNELPTSVQELIYFIHESVYFDMCV